MIISTPAALPPKESSLGTEQELELVEQPEEASVEEAAPAEVIPETTETSEESEEK